MKREATEKTSVTVTYFPKPGPANTAATLHLALARAAELGIRHIVVASTTGATALKLARLLPRNMKAACVSHHAGFARPGSSELSARTESRLNEKNIRVLRTTHLMAGLDRSIRLKFGGLGPAEIVANAYRIFGEGTKVAIEIAVMALDAGLIPYGKDIIAIAGSGSGADTAIVIRPSHSNRFFETRVREIICKPRTF
ncbi:MAG: pyruvate kinase alpha/beta domain-containing protein [candidate division WOR-3 bacterium]